MVGFDSQKESEGATNVRKCHKCQKWSELWVWALATLGLTYKSFVIPVISINPKEYNETFITKLYKVPL